MSTQSEETPEETLLLARLCPPCHPLCRTSRIPVVVKSRCGQSSDQNIPETVGHEFSYNKAPVIRIFTITQNSSLHFGSPKISHYSCLYLQKRSPVLQCVHIPVICSRSFFPQSSEVHAERLLFHILSEWHSCCFKVVIGFLHSKQIKLK